MILVLTSSGDTTADYLCTRLSKTNLAFLRLDTDLSLSQIRVTYLAGKPQLSLNTKTITPAEISHLWFRRPCPLSVKVGKDPAEIQHTAGEWSEALEGFLGHIPVERWINHPTFNVMASHKVEQLSRASSYGLHVPRTLVTQSPDEFSLFWEACGTKVIVKPMSNGFLERADPADDTHIYTNQVKLSDLHNLPALVSCPTLFQEMIDKAYDVRVTVVDDDMEAISLRAPAKDGVPTLDIRRDNMANVEYTKLTVPSAIKASLLKLISSYNLRFAAVDFGVDKLGRWYFFEINPNGQWAWLDLVGKADIGQLFIRAFEPSIPKPPRFSVRTWTIWSLLCICNFGEDVTHSEVSKRQYSLDDDWIEPDLSGHDPSDTSMKTGRFLFDETHTRRDGIDKKVSWLMTLAGVLIPLTMSLIFTNLALFPTWFPIIATVSVVGPLLVAFVLLLDYLGTVNMSKPDLNRSIIFEDEQAQKRTLLRDLIVAEDFNERTTDYLVGVYAASRRCIVFSLVMLVAIGLLAGYLVLRNPGQAESKLITALRSNPDLVLLLKGPTGDRGLKGDKGDQGLKGDPGDKSGLTQPKNAAGTPPAKGSP